MTSPLPQSKSSELIDRLNAIIARRDELELRRISNESKELIKTDAPKGHMLLGMIASMKGDTNDCEHHFKVALQLSQDPIIKSNLAKARVRLCDPFGALPLATDIYNHERDNAAALTVALQIAVAAGDIASIDCYRTAWDKLFSNRVSNFGREATLILALPNEVKAAFHSLNTKVWDAMKSKQVVHMGLTVESIPGAPILLTHFVDTAPSVAAEINETIADSLAELENAHHHDITFFVASHERSI